MVYSADWPATKSWSRKIKVEDGPEEIYEVRTLDLNLNTLKEATKIYEGPTVEVVRLFSKKVNVATP